MTPKETADFLDTLLPHCEAINFRRGGVIMIAASDLRKLIDEVVSRRRGTTPTVLVNDDNCREILAALRVLNKARQ